MSRTGLVPSPVAAQDYAQTRLPSGRLGFCKCAGPAHWLAAQGPRAEPGVTSRSPGHIAAGGHHLRERAAPRVDIIAAAGAHVRRHRGRPNRRAGRTQRRQARASAEDSAATRAHHPRAQDTAALRHADERYRAATVGGEPLRRSPALGGASRRLVKTRLRARLVHLSQGFFCKFHFPCSRLFHPVDSTRT